MCRASTSKNSRSAARLDESGEIVLLEEQDRALWDDQRIAEGLVLVEKALRRGRPGPFQVQAAIAAVHAQARRAQDTDWVEIDRLYRILERLQPSPVVTLAEALDTYFHFHGMRGALLADLGYSDEARTALERAIELARTSAEVSHLRRRLDQLEKNS